MSLNRIAASTRCRRTGCRVISAASSGVRQASSIPVPPRTSRYSGSDRPACRMNHTGRVGGPSPVGGDQRRAGGPARHASGGTAAVFGPSDGPAGQPGERGWRCVAFISAIVRLDRPDPPSPAGTEVPVPAAIGGGAAGSRATHR